MSSTQSDTEKWASRHVPKDGVKRVKPDLPPRPDWLKVMTPNHGVVQEVEKIVVDNKLNTVCHSASCPNRGECWSRGTATLMILGNICTRACGFCGVKTGRPTEYDLAEPERVAQAVALMNLEYVVVTSVDRDDLKDGGSKVWADSISAIRERCPSAGIEVLIPDFSGEKENQMRVFDARPHVLAHNLETVKRLTSLVRPQARYQRSLDVLNRAKEAGLIAKSGLMLGLGETEEEVSEALKDLRDTGCDILTIGQYMQPTPNHLAIHRWVHPDEFERHKEKALELGFAKCDSGPLVRSSYRAEEVLQPGSPLAEKISQAISSKIN